MLATNPEKLPDDLRKELARLERPALKSTATLSFGISEIDEAFPSKGLTCSALHEISGCGAEVEHGAAAALLIAGLLARLTRPVLWITERRDLFAPGLAAAGLDPDRVLLLEAGKAVLGAMEDGLRCPGLAAVVGEINGALSLTASRRLQLAAEASGVIGFALRRSRRFDDPRLNEPSAAATRWRITCLPSPPPLPHAPDTPGLGHARWRLDLVRVRGGNPQHGSWKQAMPKTRSSRIIFVWLPTWPTDRLRKTQALPRETPLVTRRHDGNRLVIAAADHAAQALGLKPGLPLAQAQSLVSNLAIADSDPTGDTEALAALAAWCLRYSPRTAADTPEGIRPEGIWPNGIWIDATGCAHLHGGEPAMLADLRHRLGSAGTAARLAIADTAGAAHAVARAGGKPISIVPQGAHAAAITPLPVAALRLDGDIIDGLRRLGIDRIGQLRALPRAPLTRRFGPALLRRLDQAFGDLDEPIAAVLPPDMIQHRLAFAEPLLTAEAFTAVIDQLVCEICIHLEETAQGVRQLDLIFERIDTTSQTIIVGTARAVRGDRHLARLLDEKLDRIDPGLGVEAMRLVASRTEPLTYTQRSAALGVTNDSLQDAELGRLIDRLENRFGAEKICRMEPVESDVPERSARRIPALAAGKTAWPRQPPRPTRLLHPPQPVEAISLLPDQPPVNFTWRRKRHRIRRADGPERIHGEWWRRDSETQAVRDYWTVEDESGRRFWLFRRGDGTDPETGDLSWFLHGLF